VTSFIAVIGFVSLLTYIPNYNDKKFTPPDIAANVAQTAAERHFSQARMNPELLMVEADHDLRDPSDMLIIDRIAKSVFHERGIGRVQTITRPLGAPIEHSSLPFVVAMNSSSTLQTAKFMNDSMASMLQQADELGRTLSVMEHMYGVMKDLTDTTHSMVGKTHELLDTTNQLRDRIADFDDFWRPIRSYFYWEKHCFDIPMCWSLRSIFDALDGIDEISEKFTGLTTDFDHLVKVKGGNDLLPRAIARKLHAPQAVVAQDIVTAGNTSSASIPLALSRMIERGEVASGSKALLLGFGAGMCYAAQVITVP